MIQPASSSPERGVRQRGRRRRVSVGLVATALVLAACSGSEEPVGAPSPTAPSPAAAPEAEAPTGAPSDAPVATGDVPQEIVERLRTVADTMAQQTTASIWIDQELAGSGADRELSQRGEGVIDFTTGALQLTLESSALAGMGEGAGEVEIILVDDDVYLSMEAMGGQWVRMSASDERIDDQLDPQANFDHLAESLSGGEEAGSEDVRGATTTRYDLVVDLSEQLEAADPEQRRAIEDQMETFDTTRLPMSVWVDEDELIRRQRYEFTTQDPQTGQAVTMTQTIEYADFGADVTVTAPADAVDMSEIMGQMPTER